MSERVKETFINRGPNYVEPEEINNVALGQEKVYLSENDR